VIEARQTQRRPIKLSISAHSRESGNPTAVPKELGPRLRGDERLAVLIRFNLVMLID
jgi:hypothetical protein